MSEIFLSVVVPAYNEETRLVPSLRKIADYLLRQSYAYEVIVVSDGSRDGTAAAARRFCPAGFPLIVIDRKENRGKGYTVREGVAASRGKFVLFSDADLSTPIEEVEKLLPFFREGCDVAIASRSLKSSEILVRQPWHRELMGKVFNRIVRFFAVPGIIDTQCGFKCFSRRAVATIFPLCRVDGFAFDVEILYLARKRGLQVREVPVRWIDSPRSTVSPLRDSAKMFREVMALRWSDWRGAYKKRE
jgi:dolichyl-phosphate beta-glucosyltransferase